MLIHNQRIYKSPAIDIYVQIYVFMDTYYYLPWLRTLVDFFLLSGIERLQAWVGIELSTLDL